MATRTGAAFALPHYKRLALTILSLTLDRIDDNNVRPHWHV